MKYQTSTSWLLASFVALAAGGAIAQSTDNASRSTSSMDVAPDNTKSNRQDPSNTSQSADSQKDNASDLKIAQEIRRSVMSDKTLSTYAHNAKIISVNGTVTLNGVVHSQAESTNIAQKAEQVVGSTHVVNKLKIDAAK